MDIPQYITVKEVKRICKVLGIRDWSSLSDEKVDLQEAEIILKAVNVKGMNIAVEDFRRGLEVELEHGTQFEDANVTNNHPILTGMIVVAHLKETLDYYKRLDLAETEADLLEAVLSKNLERIESKYKKLIKSQIALNQIIAKKLR